MIIRKVLSVQGQMQLLEGFAAQIPDPRLCPARCTYSIADFVLAEAATQFLNYPSALRFDRDCRQRGALSRKMSGNLTSLFGVSVPPSDSRIREVLDEVDPVPVHRMLDRLINECQKGKILDQFKTKEQSFLVAIDGVEYFSSKKIGCSRCCVRHHNNGVEYYHQALVPVIVSPTSDHVLYLSPEMIQKEDGDTKNDCELNAVKRLIPSLRRHHPHLSMVLLMDGLFSKAPVIQLCRDHDLGFIIVAKPGDHTFLFSEGIREALARMDTDQRGPFHGIVEGNEEGKPNLRFYNDVQLNESTDIRINFLAEERLAADGSYKISWSWITDEWITAENAERISHEGHKRWTIENGAFNRATNRGGHLKHNFGHGNNHLTENIFGLKLIAQTITNILEIADRNWGEAAGLHNKKNDSIDQKYTESTAFIDSLREAMTRQTFQDWVTTLCWFRGIEAQAILKHKAGAIILPFRAVGPTQFARPPPVAAVA